MRCPLAYAGFLSRVPVESSWPGAADKETFECAKEECAVWVVETIFAAPRCGLINRNETVRVAGIHDEHVVR